MFVITCLMTEFVKTSRHFIISDCISCDIHSHIDLYVGSGCNIVKGEKSLTVGSRVWLEQVFLSLVMEKLKKNKCVAVKQNTVESRFTDTSLTPMCCNKPFLLEGK